MWKRVSPAVKPRGLFSFRTVAKAALTLLLGATQLSVALGLLLVGREPALVTRICNMCLGFSLFLSISLAATDAAVSLCLGCSVNRRSGKAANSQRRWMLLVALVSAVGLSFAGLLGVTQFTVERIQVPIRGLSQRLNGTTIVQLSDIHLGGYSGRSTLQRIVDEVNKLDADIVAITGDLVVELWST